MEPLLDMRVSRVAPMVEGNLVELVDMVKQMGRKGSDLTESQNRKMVGYLGNLDEMRQQIVIMVQRYEDDPKVLKRLLDLLDRIDDVKNLAITSEASQPLASPALESDNDIARRYDTPFNPLMVSTINILDVSGLFADNIKEEDLVKLEEEEEDVGDEFWDHEIDHDSLAPHDDTPQEVSGINLSMSNMHLPNLFDSGSNFPPISPSPLLSSQIASSSSAPSTPLNGPERNKEKGKSKLSQSFSNIEAEVCKGKGKQPSRKEKGKGKGKGKEKAYKDSSDENSSDSYSGSEDEANGAGSWKRGVAPGRGNLPPNVRPPVRSSLKLSASESESESGTGSETESSSEGESKIPIPPPPPKPGKKYTGKKYKVRVGPCDPVLCKICYDEYNTYEQVYEFSQCKHAYCTDCLKDYLVTHINEGAVLDLVCPFPDCTTEVMPTDIKALCNSDTIAKYERFTVLAALRADPNARWCPNPYCNNGIKYNADTMPWVYCDACHFEFCFHCMGERHDGAACGDEALAYLKKRKESEDAAMIEFTQWTSNMQAYVKPCPGCKAYIEKNDGCNHMTCTNQSCRTQFCWLCLNIYMSDHFQDDVNFPDCYEKQYYIPYDYPRAPAVQPLRRRRFTNVAKKVGMFVGVGVAVVTLGVPAAVIGGPVYGCFQLHKRLKARRRSRRAANSSYHDDNWVPPSPARIAEAAREARRLYELEHGQ